VSRRKLAAATVVLALVAVACGGGSSKKAAKPSSSAPTGASTTAASKLPVCPLDALKKASGPVEIVMWHAMQRANADELNKLVTEFEASQPKVKVKLVANSDYNDVLAKFKAGIQTGDLPDVAQMEDTNLQFAVDSGEILPAQSCVTADQYDLSGHLPRVLDYFTIGGVLWPMPFNASNPLLYYDKHDFQAAGLDPEKPPATLDDVLADAKKLQAAGQKVPFAMKMDSWHLEQMLQKANALYVNNANGRTKRSTASVIGGKSGETVFAWYAALAKGGLVKGIDKTTVDNLLALSNGDVAMTIDSSAALGTAFEVLASGGQADKQLQLGIGPLPAPPGRGGVAVAGAGLYMMKRSSPEKQAAAWEWLKFLNSPKVMAEWCAATGYLPIVRAAVDEPVLQARWAQRPEFKVAYEQLASGPATPATAGPVFGPYSDARKLVVDQIQRVVTQGADPAEALTTAKSEVDKLIGEYNSRVGG